MDNNVMEMDEQARQLRTEFDELQTHEFRQDVRLSENEQDNLETRIRGYHTLEGARAENLRITKMLDNADEIRLEEYQKTDLKLRLRQNKNFELINSERDGGDSDEMRMVKDSIKGIDSIMREPVGKAFNRKTVLTA